MIGGTEVLVIGLIVVVLFGASALPKLARSLGQAKKEFQKGFDESRQKALNSSEVESTAAEQQKEN